ncbi:hypothetical protein BKA61DRAFT_603117, partial [Leptodontidium sp. MPI-SDFR-AT-0119]
MRFYILERFLLQKVYGKTYTQMNETTRRGFVNHHIAGATKILILVLAACTRRCTNVDQYGKDYRPT